MSPAQAAAILRRDVDELRRWRDAGIGPTFYRIGRRVIRYSAHSVYTYAHTQQ